MRTSNPVLNSNAFRNADVLAGEPMTVQGAVNKTGVLLVLALAGAAWTWTLTYQGQTPAIWMIGGIIGGLIFALVTIFKPVWAPVTAPVYAVCEGLFLGGLSALLEMKYPGIAIQAVGGTFGTLAVMLVLYTTRLIRVTDKLRFGIVAATGAIALLYLVSLVLSLFGVAVPLINDPTPLGIIFSVVVICVAALNLLLDFDLIERGAEAGAPKYMEWYGAFGLLVTLVWLYIEFLRLLSKARR